MYVHLVRVKKNVYKSLFTFGHLWCAWAWNGLALQPVLLHAIVNNHAEVQHAADSAVVAESTPLCVLPVFLDPPRVLQKGWGAGVVSGGRERPTGQQRRLDGAPAQAGHQVCYKVYSFRQDAYLQEFAHKNGEKYHW